MPIIHDQAEQVARCREMLAERDNSPAFVVGYLTSTVRTALAAHPGDRHLLDSLAMIEAFHLNQRAEVEAFRQQVGR